MKQRTTMDEVRSEIDRVDRMIITLITERLEYIRQAGHIKQNRTKVRDKARANDVMAKVLSEARRLGCSQNLIELIYTVMIEWCIQYEFTVFDNRTSQIKALND